MQMLSPNPSDVIASDGARCCELSTAGSRAVGGVERSPSHSGLACHGTCVVDGVMGVC